MKNLFKSVKTRKRNKAQLQRLSMISGVFKIIKNLEDAELLSWIERRRQLFIQRSLAIVILAQGKDAWHNFLNNLYLYTVLQLQSRAWDALLIKEQGKAIADERKRHTGSLTSAEIREIRSRVRRALDPEAIQPPRIEQFEFMVVDESDKEIVLCGVYDPETEQLDMALWEDLLYLLPDNTK